MDLDHWRIGGGWPHHHRDRKGRTRKLEESFDTTSKSISFHAKRKRDYSIAYHYLANDKVKTASDVFRFSDKLLQLDIDAPSVISPGQEVDMTVSVKDAFDKPQPNVDLTAFAFTNKFKESSDTYLKNYSKIYKARKVFNNFFTKDTRDQYRNTIIKKPDWLERFAVRDSLFYQFLFPQNGLFTATIPVENRTEFAPYIIENGEYQDIKYLVVDHVPVYLGLAAQSQRYSFQTDNQPHNLLIRTSTKIVELKNVVFKPNHKTILGIDPTKEHSNIKVTTLSSMATPFELAMLNDLLMPIRKTVSLPKNSYIKQKERVFYIDKKQPEEQIIGPLFERKVDFLAPDFYNPSFKQWNDLFTRQGDPLFIPEHKFDETAPFKGLYAIGHYEAIGFSPFSIESIEDAKKEPLGKIYDLVQQLTPTIEKYKGQGKIDGVLLDKENNTQLIKMGDYEFTFKHDYTLNWSDGAKAETWPMSSAIIIEISKDEFYISGSGIVVTFKSLQENGNAGILKTDQGKFENEKWKTIRHFNGDQTHQGRHLRISVGDYEIQKIKLYSYE